MRDYFVFSSKRPLAQLDAVVDEVLSDLKKAHEQIDKLKLSVWKLENPPKFKFNDKVLFKPHRFKEAVIEKEPIIIKGESSVGKSYFYSTRQNDFERFYYVEVSNRIITISENNLVKLTD